MVGCLLLPLAATGLFCFLLCGVQASQKDPVYLILCSGGQRDESGAKRRHPTASCVLMVGQAAEEAAGKVPGTGPAQVAAASPAPAAAAARCPRVCERSPAPLEPQDAELNRFSAGVGRLFGCTEDVQEGRLMAFPLLLKTRQ